MRNATRVTVATFGTLAALAGLEHGVGEIVQGNRAPAGIMIGEPMDDQGQRVDK